MLKAERPVMAKPNSNPKIVVVGSINCDIVSYLKQFPKANETVFAHGYEIAIGGKGLNQAVAASRIGGQVSMIGCVGNDDFGRQATAHLVANDVNCDSVMIAETAPTGVAAIAVNDAGDNMISVASGANLTLSVEHVLAHRAVIENADVLITQAEVSVEVMVAALEIANSAGVPSVLNPAPAEKTVLPLLKYCTYITPNESETETLSGYYPEGDDNIDNAIAALREQGAENIVITCGSRGSLIGTDGAPISVAPYKVKSVDSTGAGDTFNGVFAVGVATGLSARDAAKQASAAAAISVTRKTANSAPTRAEVDTFVSDNG